MPIEIYPGLWLGNRKDSTNINFIKKVESSPNLFYNKILFFIFVIERKIIKILDLPLGISLLGLFKKK